MKRVLVLKDGKRVVIETVLTIKQINSIVERFNRNGYTIKVYSV